MVYAYDRAIPLPVKDLYDTQVMAMSINAAKDMYEKGQKQIDDFYEKYGDFLSPFAKDMERYGQIVGGVRDIINNAYANGVDPLRSPEGRTLVAQAIRSVNPAEINAMRANAKMGYAYQDALQALRKVGKYSQEQEDFDIAQTGGPSFQDFATANGQGGFNSWDRSSPIQATSLRELTQDSYKGRTPRTLTKEDFKNDPRLAGKYAYDPRYEWTGYLDSDLMKVAPGASASLAGDPRAAFFRDQARQMVIASGKVPTAENIEAQFQRNIANANDWALVDPTRKADQFALQDQAHRHAVSNIYLQNRLQGEREQERYKNQLALQLLKNQGKVPSKYKSLGNSGGQSVYHVTEETQLDGIYNSLKHLGVKVPKLTIKDNKIKRQVDKNGKQQYIDIDDASAEELRYAAAHKNELLRAVSTKMKSYSKQYGSDYLHNKNAQTDYLDTFGFKVGADQASVFFNNKKLAPNGGIMLSRENLKNMESLSTIMAGTFNSGKKYSDDQKLKEILSAYSIANGNLAYERAKNAEKKMDIQWSFDATSPKNAINRPSKNGGTETLLKGTARVQWGDTNGDMIDIEQWLPIGLVSEAAAMSNGQVKASDFELRGENRSGYLDIDAGYMKSTGSQKQANPALTDLGLDSIESTMNSYYDENSLAEILNQLQQ